MKLRRYAASKNGQRSLRAIGFFIAFYCGLTLFTTLSQERLVYLPGEQNFLNCSQVELYGLVPQEYNGTRFYGPNEISSSSKLVVVYHGNAGSACDRTYYLPYIAEAGAEAMLVEYSGYSNDIVSPGHVGVKNDVKNSITFLREQEIEDVIVIGESIGTGPATLHASKRKPVNLILITPFTSLKDLAGYHYWYFPTDLLVNNAFDNTVTLAAYSGPRTFIHGANDEIVPFFMSQELQSIRPDKTKLYEIENANHNQLFSFPEFGFALSSALSSPPE